MSKVKALAYLNKIEPYLPGDFSVEGVSEIVKLSSNESPLGASPNAVTALDMVGHDLKTYPDSSASLLRNAIGKKYGLNPERIVCESGSEQIINLLARGYAQSGDEILYSQYGFIAYKIAALSVGATPVAAPETHHTTSVDNLLSLVTERTRIVFLANPNNPTGTLIKFSEIERLRSKLPDDVLLVLDAAYAEYSIDTEYQDGCNLVDTPEANVVVLHTFSKIYALAGLRLGWCYAPAEIVEVLHNLRGVFSVSSAAQAAGIAALEDEQHITRSIKHNTEARAFLGDALSRAGLKVLPSSANFICVQFDSAESATAADLLLRQNGLIPRTLKEYGLSDCIRITIGLMEHCEKVARLLTNT
jgi:histidinol-phosphate aminotransferase